MKKTPYPECGRKVCKILLAVGLVLVPFTHAYADMLNLTGAETAPNIAEITVLDDRVNVRLEVYVGDLEYFEDLIPDDMLKEGGADRPSEDERMTHFSTSVLSIRGPNGVLLPAELRLAEPRLRVDRKSRFAGRLNPSTGQRVPEAPADKRVLFAEIDYPFSGRPSSLTISPPTAAGGNTIVSIGFIAYHKAVPVIDFRYLSSAATLRLDWNDPWYSRFDNRNLKRHHKSALMSFLYIEPREIRHEVLIRVRDLQDWIHLALGGKTMIDSTDQAEIKKRARQFFEARNPLRVEDAPRQPASSRAEFVKISLTGLTVVEEGQPLELSTAILGIILSYPVEHMPQNVSVEWDLFNERIDRVPTSSIDPAGPFASFVDVENPTIEWQNFLRTYIEPTVTPVTVSAGNTITIPITSLALALGAMVAVALAVRTRRRARLVFAAVSLLFVAGATLLLRANTIEVSNPLAGPPDEAVSVQIIKAALDNVHAAYLEKREPQLTRALSMVVAEEGATEVRTELDRALAIKVAGGGTARVTAIEDLTATDISALDGRTGFRTLAEWTAQASSSHWGHLHVRRIRFRALMELAEIEGVWKIAGMTVLDKRQAS